LLARVLLDGRDRSQFGARFNRPKAPSIKSLPFERLRLVQGAVNCSPVAEIPDAGKLEGVATKERSNKEQRKRGMEDLCYVANQLTAFYQWRRLSENAANVHPDVVRNALLESTLLSLRVE